MKKISIYKSTLFKVMFAFVFSFLLLIIFPNLCLAMPPGALLYRTSTEGKMFGYSSDPLVYSEKSILKNVYSGHVGIYIGKENGVDYVVEALNNGVVKTPADKFVNLAEGEKYLGAKIPKNISSTQQAKVVEIAKSLVGKNLSYDYDFKVQKGPGSGEWTCVGLTEKIYESANISNPNNLESLEYDENYYALNITPDGFDNYNKVNDYGDCFSPNFEFSKIGRRTDILIPAPEIIGFNIGLERNGERYIFLPYTQYLQPTLNNVQTDIKISSSFQGPEVRGLVNAGALALRWSLINNPVSSVKIIANKVADVFASFKNSIFGGGSEITKVTLTDALEEESPEVEALVKVGAVVNKSLKDNNSAIKTKTSKNNSTATSNLVAGAVNVKKQSSALVNKDSSSTKISTSKNSETNTDNSNNNIVKAATANKSTSTTQAYYNPSKTTAKSNTTTKTVSNGSRTGASSSWTSSGSSSSGSNNASDNYLKIATINKIYSTGNDDFIELYNPGEKDFDLSAASYRLEKAKTAEDPSLMIRIGDTDDASYPGGTVIKAKKTYLLVSNKASLYWQSKADAIVSREEFSWPGSGYTIYLGTGAISSSKDSDILEAIGFGSDTTYFQGEAPAEEIKDYYILNRIKSINNNKLDFNLIKSDDPSIDWASLVIASTSEEQVISSDNISTTSNEVASSSDEISSTTEVYASSSNQVATSSQNTSSSIPLILINKIYSTGNNDYLELFNFSDFDFDLASALYRLEKSKSALDPALIMRIGDSADGLYPGGTLIKSKSKYLIVSSDANDFYKSQAQAIATRTDFSWFNSGYSLYLGNGAISSNLDENILDLVGFGGDAVYYKGAPASEITDNYVLNRISDTSNNILDFNLIKSNDPNIDWSGLDLSEDNLNTIYNFSASSYNLFPAPNPINSNGLAYLWHFEECSGLEAKSSIGSSTLSVENYWVPGKFFCAKENAYNKGTTKGVLDEELDINNFTISFWYKSIGEFPRLSLTMSNSDSEYINMTLEQGLMQFNGLAAPEWRNYDLNFAFDDTWRQATLVVNRNDGYWSLYVDGILKYHVDTYKLLGRMNHLEFGGDNSSYALDEVAIWNRALLEEEIIDIRNQDQIYNPASVFIPQKKAILRHFWNFNEGIGASSTDLVGGAKINLNPENWLNINLTDSALASRWPQKFNVNLSEINSEDLSLSFWWRSPKMDEEGRVRISLGNELKPNLLSLAASYYISSYSFNDNSGYFSFGENLTVPHDLNWHLLALVYDSYRNELNYYIDGVLKSQKYYLGLLDQSNINSLEILPENWSTEIDDLGIWQGALSAAQIQEIFANNK